jgi:hypothetical protein
VPAGIHFSQTQETPFRPVQSHEALNPGAGFNLSRLALQDPRRPASVEFDGW